jgi:hypothetical protein
MFCYITLPAISNIESGLDPSWRAYLAYAFQNKITYGKDVVFTYGIFSQIATGQYSKNLLLFIFLFSYISAVYSYMVIRMLGNLRALIFLIMTVILFCKLRSGGLWDPFYVFTLFLISNLFLNNHLNAIARLALIICLALIAHIKVSYAVLAVISLIVLLYKKRFLDVAMAVSFYIVIWLLYDPNILHLYGFLKYSHEIATGYNLSMQNYTEQPYDYTNIYSMINLFLFILSGITYYTFDKKIINSLLVYAFSFVMYKESVVRADGHVMAGAFFIFLLGCFIVLVNIPGKKNYKFNAIRKIIFTILLFIGSLFILLNFIPGKFWFPQLPEFIKEYASSAYNENNTQLKIMNTYNFPKLTGCTDLYPYNITALITSKNKMCIRPVFQSYSAYTPELLKLNLDHLSNLNVAPNYIFWSISTIDNRYPTQDDSLSWPAILANYSLEKKLSSEYILLKRNIITNDYQLNKLEVINRPKLGQIIMLRNHDSSLVWLKVDVKPTLLERIMSFIYKPNQINLKLNYSDGTTAEYKLLPEIARAGFIISPTINDNSDFSCLFTVNGKFNFCGKSVLSFVISTPNNKFRSMYNMENMIISSIQFKAPLTYNKSSLTNENKPIDNVKKINTEKLNSALDIIKIHNNALQLMGWGYIPGYDISKGFIKYILLESGESTITYKTDVVERPDVATAFKSPSYKDSGFSAEIPLSRLKATKYNIYLYITNGTIGGIVPLKKDYIF